MADEKNAGDAQEELERWHSVLLDEYRVLKSEQVSRIGFRDNLLYVAVGALGGVASVALGGIGSGNGPMYEVFLLGPWVTTILGWTYLNNDRKITDIRRYIDGPWRREMEKTLPPGRAPMQWEIDHRRGAGHDTRKSFQLMIDLVTFVFSGAVALVAYFLKAPAAWPSYVFVALEGAMLVFLAWQFYSQFRIALKPS